MLRETARLALSRALGCVEPGARLSLITRLLEAPPPSSAVAALLLTRLKRDAASEWPPTSTSTSTSTPFVSPAMLSLVEGQIARTLDANRGGSSGSVGWSGADASWLQDPSGAADVIGAALNVVRYVLMRERSGDAPTDHTGAWRRREELLGRFVTPAMEWAREHLERIASAAAGEAAEVESEEVCMGKLSEAEVDGDGEDKAAWEAQMGLHHVVEVGARIVEFCDQTESSADAMRSCGVQRT